MRLATTESSGISLQVRRLNTAYVADIKNGIKFWLYSLVFFGGFHLLTAGFNKVLQWANSAPIHVFPSGAQLLLLAGGSALVIAVSLLPDSELLYSKNFSFDTGKNAFSANNRFVTGLDKITVHLQDGFGPSRRALRIVVTAWGRNYVVAQTPRFTTATLAGKEYSSTVTSEGIQKKHWFNQWADYAGAKTSFSSEWPEYQEILALHTELTQFVEAAKNKPQTERQR